MQKISNFFVSLGALIVLLFSLNPFFYNSFQPNKLTLIILLFAGILSYSIGYTLWLLKKGSLNIKKIALSALIQFSAFFIIGLVYKILSWHYVEYILILSVFLFLFVYTPLNFKIKYNKWKSYTRISGDALLLSLFDFLWLVAFLTAVAFFVFRLKWINIMLISESILGVLSIIVWNLKFKREIIFRKKSEDKLNEALHEMNQQNQIIEEKNKILEQQNEEILTINNSLEEQKKLTETMNAELMAQNEEISAQRDLVSEQNNSINESIIYAKRIQSAVLPHQAYIDEILLENFIINRPRNMVSGDFYWVKQVNNQILITVADCTGHGVPGAIMSMLGISFMNQIVQKHENIRPSHILNDLRKQIKKSLRQTGKRGAPSDGMDMALCALDPKTNILQYAGSNNPLYLVRNGDLIEIKADRMPIGFYPNEKPTFTNHEIQLYDGDIFYLFSDGFVDQFGGENDTKYKSSNFKKKLIEIHQKPLVYQKELLETELDNWMKGYKQTDDILVMGVRI